MGRLTERDKHEQGIWVEDSSCSYHFFDINGDMYSVINKLAHYEDMEEQGRLIELPCAVGSTIYAISEVVGGYEVVSFKVGDVNASLIFKDEIGKSLYLTKEEAEAKLKELKGDKE